jgi:hypothetical protein
MPADCTEFTMTLNDYAANLRKFKSVTPCSVMAACGTCYLLADLLAKNL